MANTKISQLTANTNPNGNEELVYAYNNANGKMTTGTLKTFIWSWKQDTLVSGTNIKTINWYDILWSGNLSISWGGGSIETWYQAIVDASGNGDYTTITAALAGGNKSILVLPWTYNETEWNDITDSGVVIHGVDEGNTVINVALETDGYFIKHVWTGTWTIVDDIRNLTFNVTCKKNTSYVIDWYITDTWKYIDVTIDNCTFNITSTVDCWAYILRWYNIKYNKWLYNNNNINVYDSWHYIWLDNGYMWQFNNCKLYLKATWSRVALSLDNLDKCSIAWDATDSWWTYVSLNDIINSDVNIDDNATLHKGRLYIGDARNSSFQESNTVYPSTDISWSTSISDWATSTAYSVWDYVWYNGDLLECIEAHTSWDTAPWQDESKWDYVTALLLRWDIEWCSIHLWSWNIKRIISLFGEAVSYIPCKFENNNIENGKLFSWWYLIINWNELTTNFLQNRWWASVISWNRIIAPGWDCALYYADNYSLIHNNIVAWTSNNWAITILWSTTNTSEVWDNLLMKTSSL